MTSGAACEGFRQCKRDVLISRFRLLLPSTTARDNDVFLAIYLIDGWCCDACSGQRSLPQQFARQLIETSDLLISGRRDKHDTSGRNNRRTEIFATCMDSFGLQLRVVADCL